MVNLFISCSTGTISSVSPSLEGMTLQRISFDDGVDAALVLSQCQALLRLIAGQPDLFANTVIELSIGE